MIGLLVDIAGGFLVAVEAIKIENLRVLRDRFLKRTNSYILGPRIAPQQIMDDLNSGCNIESAKRNETNDSLPAMGCLTLLSLHVIAGLFPLFLIDKFTNGIVHTICLSEFSKLNLSLRILIASIAVICGIPLFGAIGSGIFSSISFGLKSTMKAIDFIEAETPNGTTGIIGFLLLTLGFLLQFLATYLTL
jgi:hypothetical protein